MRGSHLKEIQIIWQWKKFHGNLIPCFEIQALEIGLNIKRTNHRYLISTLTAILLNLHYPLYNDVHKSEFLDHYNLACLYFRSSSVLSRFEGFPLNS
ncbi:unnamed protein product [Rotaria sp. Silwood2]|nr:unnamed protein product [Rotaria sp. Silwood2]CAF2840731.1 unnamed protein product [Rotaria sp. Silwood2]CAF3369075.1 unnamed protein product [Rotaria sp. Silwood2]CAF3371228.1 unnamed protein product [Rotaria sp. Silwood2]CAF4215566.1 unnamed protein product [Rotaria sp. Silwood2]